MAVAALSAIPLAAVVFDQHAPEPGRRPNRRIVGAA